MPRIKGVGELDWKFDTPVSRKSSGSDVIRGLHFVITDLPDKLDFSKKNYESLLFEYGKSVLQSQWLYDVGTNHTKEEEATIIPFAVRNVARLLSRAHPQASDVGDHLVQVVVRKGEKWERQEIKLSLVETNVPYRRIYEIGYPTRYIESLARKMNTLRDRTDESHAMNHVQFV